MKYTVNVSVDGRICPVTVSDENKALLAAKAAGGAVVGIWRENRGENRNKPGDENRSEPGDENRNEPGGDTPGMSCGEAETDRDTSGLDACLYLVTGEEDVTADLLEKAARRHLGLPWIIADTPRLRIREFTDNDPLEKPNPWDCGVFAEEETRRAYIRHQYRFSEHGLWALEEKAGGRIIGKAGITDIAEGEEISALRKTANSGLTVDGRTVCSGQDGYGQTANSGLTVDGWTVCSGKDGNGQTANSGQSADGQTERTEAGERIYVLLFDEGKPDSGNGCGFCPGTAVGELGYHIYPEYRGQGFAEEACRAVLRYAEKEMELDGAFLRIRNDNTASQMLAKKLGFQCNSTGKPDEI
ncbi:MAG: GNAT family N-acetyltransferase [Bacillota bacterium]|nr:GNAT family N-acetyltransferase [Bacillota bacterium]